MVRDGGDGAEQFAAEMLRTPSPDHRPVEVRSVSVAGCGQAEPKCLNLLFLGCMCNFDSLSPHRREHLTVAQRGASPQMNVEILINVRLQSVPLKSYIRFAE